MKASSRKDTSIRCLADVRMNSGVQSIELVVGIAILVPILLYSIDFATIFVAGIINDNSCNAAVRAAAAGPPSNYSGKLDTPKARASAMLATMAQRAKTIIRVSEFVRAREIELPPYPDSQLGGPVRGTVTIKTRCDVYPPFLLPLVTSHVVLYSTQTFPWTWMEPPSDAGVLSGPTKPSPVTGGDSFSVTNDLDLAIQP
jgi:hypothetical protein